MRILLVPNSYPPVVGGLQMVVHTLAQHLLQRGHETQVVTNHYPRSLPTRETLDKVVVRRWLFLQPKLNDLWRSRPDLFLASFYFYPLNLLRFSHLMQTFRPEVVNIHFPDSQPTFILWLRHHFNFRLVVSLHGNDIERWFGEPKTPDKKTGNNGVWRINSPRRQERSSHLRLVLQEADAVTACSRHLLEKATLLEPGVEQKGHVTYNGIDLNRFKDKKQYAHSRFYILAYGRLTYIKGFDMLLEAFAQVACRYPQVDLILAGDGEEREALYNQAQQLGLEGRVHLFGQATSEEVVGLLNGCLFVVVPSRQEAFGLVALEALAAGKPVLATRVGGLPEFIEDSANALVEPAVDCLAQGLEDWLRRSAEVKTSEEQNRQWAAKYTWSHTVERYLNVYCETINK